MHDRRTLVQATPSSWDCLTSLATRIPRTRSTAGTRHGPIKDLNSCVEYYPTGTAATMKELGEGSRDMTVTMTGWDLNPRILGIVPKSYKVAPFKGMTWVNDAHNMPLNG